MFEEAWLPSLTLGLSRATFGGRSFYAGRVIKMIRIWTGTTGLLDGRRCLSSCEGWAFLVS